MMPSGAGVETLQINGIVMGLLGGLAIFLIGMEQMATALKLVAGDGLKNILSKLTTNRLPAQKIPWSPTRQKPLPFSPGMRDKNI